MNRCHIQKVVMSYVVFNFIFPVHLNPNIKLIVEDKLKNYLNVHLLKTLLLF